MSNLLVNKQSSDVSYQASNYAGSYQFVSLHEIIANFMIAYVGEDKLISKISQLDVEFHAKRALQELSFDTLRSTKAFEFTVPSSLREILPVDYINYTKVVRVDDSGIEHPIYPTSITSNPQYTGNEHGGFDDAHLNYDASSYELGEDSGGDAFHWSDNFHYGGAIVGGTVNNDGDTSTAVGPGTQIKIPLPDLQNGKNYAVRFTTNKLTYNSKTIDGLSIGARGKFTVTMYGDRGHRWVYGYDRSDGSKTKFNVGAGDSTIAFRTSPISSFYTKHLPGSAVYESGHEKCLIIEVIEDSWVGVLSSIVIVEKTDGDNFVTQQNNNSTGGPSDSKTWNNYKSNTSSENNNNDYEDDTYWPHDGRRYGLDPQHAHVNGSYYIDSHTGFIHFSADLAGKIVILKYLTDSMSVESELEVHRFAEEAIYKWILYAISSTRANAPARQLMLLKKEKRAAIRQAKLRLSNIKLEEITQVLRGKSKQIKH